MKWALYDLKNQPPSHDFITFCHYAKREGSEGVWFLPGYNRQPDYQQNEGEQERVKTLLIPLCEKYGFAYRLNVYPPETPEPESEIVFPGGTHFDQFSHRFHDVKKLKEPMPLMPSVEALDWANDRFKGRRPIVVSIRNAKYQLLRNSSEDWYRWASDHSAEIVKDYLDEKLTLDQRLACYELASLNIGVHQGPMLLNWFSYRPYLVVKHIINKYKVMNEEWVGIHHKFYRGDQMPWATKAQKILWNSDDDYETIEREYQTYLEENR